MRPISPRLTESENPVEMSITLRVAREIAAADAGHGKKENDGSGEDSGYHDSGGTGERGGEPLQGRNGMGGGSAGRE